MNTYLFDTDSTNDRNIIALSDYGIPNAQVIGRYKYNSARKELSDHYHKDMIEICYCHKGNQVYSVGEQVYPIKGGDVFVTFPNEVHSTGTHPEEKGVLYWLLVHIPADKTFFKYNQTESEAFINALTNLPGRHFKGSPKMRETLESIIETAGPTPGDLQKITIENLLISFLLQVIEAASLATKAIKPVSDNAVRIERFIAGHYKEGLSVAVMANALNLSESRFKSWFKQEFGVPPLEYILRKRIDEAKKIMQLPNAMSISNMAYYLGFSSPQHFATIFKRYTFLSPKEFKASGCLVTHQ